jgi:hypothetical protein
MEQTGLRLDLNVLQCKQWYAQIFTYMYYLLFQYQGVKDQVVRDTVQGLGIQLCGLSREEHTERCFVLNAEEVQVVKQMFIQLQQVYEVNKSAEHANMAFEHLTACRALLQQAEREQQACHATQEERA